DNPVIVRQASVNIAKHLLYACRVFGDKKAEDVPVDSLPGLLDSAPETSPAADAVPLAADDPFSMPVVIAPKGNPDGESEAIPVPADEGEAVAIAEPMEAEAIAEPVSDQANAHAVAEAVPAHAIAEPTPAAVSRRVSSEISRVIEERHADTGGGHGHGGGPGGARDKAFDEARRKQLRMLPEPPEIDGLECAVVYQPCDMVGGDFYDFIELPNNRLGIVQGDVSGHGLEVWGDMTMAMKTLRIYARQSTSAREMLVNANEDLVPDLMAKTFVSGFYCILDLETFKMKMARAGHNPLILFNPDRKPQSLIQYEPRGMVLGMARGNMFNNSLEELEIQLYSGDMLLWYTDGVTETMNPDGDEYGIERFCSVIEQHGRREAEYLLQQIMDAVGVFREGAPPDDDVTLVAVRII
ncbi:MAG: PP2C family protein-serine/threonine phosphatase, partial [Planctomycetota bacterium]